jgi:6-phosphofructokinase 2
VVVSLGPQGALGVDASGSVQVVPPPMKSQSTVGAGDSMVGAMTLRLAEDASLEDMVALASPPVAPPPLIRVPACARWKIRKKSTLICAVAFPFLC